MFKNTYSKAHHVAGAEPELGQLIKESYDIYEDSRFDWSPDPSVID